MRKSPTASSCPPRPSAISASRSRKSWACTARPALPCWRSSTAWSSPDAMAIFLHRRLRGRRSAALTPLLALTLMLVLAAGSAHAVQQLEREREEPQGYRFQILTGDDSAVTHRITEDLYKRLVPT